MLRKFFILLILPNFLSAQNLRDRGIEIGILGTGKNNAITDVAGVKVGQVSIRQGDRVHTGVTAIIPHEGNVFQEKVPAAMHLGNGFGKLTGFSQVEELGNIETPIILTNTLSVPTAADALIDYTFSFEENNDVRSVNPIVGETNDGYLNDIRGRHVQKAHVLEALAKADTGKVEQGAIGAGTGTICFGWKGGIGTSSRKLPKELGGYTLGVLVQSNFGGVLEIAGVPVGKELGQYYFKNVLESSDGSCMMVVATDAPLDARNLKRLAKRALLGLGKTGGVMSNGSGDYVIAFSTATNNRVSYQSTDAIQEIEVLRNGSMTPLFIAVIEATEEAILNSLFAAKTTIGQRGKIEALPVERIMEILKKYGKLPK